MINFLRKTRKKLADDNKPLKCMRYAVGEILLVVIGILIALQINNWNEGKKYITQEKNILSSLLKDFEHNKSLLESSSEVYTNIVSRLEAKLRYIGGNSNELTQEMKDTLTTISTWTPLFSNGTLNSIMNSNQLGLIRNENLKTMLTAYPSSFDIAKEMSKKLKKYVFNVEMPFIDSYISFWKDCLINNNILIYQKMLCFQTTMAC